MTDLNDVSTAFCKDSAFKPPKLGQTHHIHIYVSAIKFYIIYDIFGRPFVKQFALCYRTVVLSCDVGALWPSGWTDQDKTSHVGRPRPWPHCVRQGLSSLSPKGVQPPNFRPISVEAKWLDGPRCHLVWR